MLIIPIFVPHEGCPHDCCFCNQRKISGQTELRLRRKLDKRLIAIWTSLVNYDDVQVAFFGASFTGISQELQRQYLETVASYIRKNLIHSIRISTRPDYIDPEILAMLREYSVRTIELGAQSMDDDVLRLSGRGHTAADTARAASLIRNSGFELGLQTMTGLPGASYESDIATAEKIISLHPDLVTNLSNCCH